MKFGTIKVVQNNKLATLIKGIKPILQLYKTSGFQVMTALMDGEFDHLYGEMADIGMTLNSTSDEEHMGDVE